MNEKYIEIVLVFLRLGLFSFGGPAAHISMMEEEIVSKRKWIDQKEFIDLLGFTNMIPGPNSTEMAILLGLKRAGKIGLLLAGVSFIAPAMLIVLLLGSLYSAYGELPQIQSIFLHIKPVIVAIITIAIIKLFKVAIKNILGVMIFVLSIVLLLAGFNEILVLITAGFMYFLFKQSKAAKTLAVDPVSLLFIFLTFLKIGSVLYGSGYVLLSFIQSEFIEGAGILTRQQMLDAITVGEMTPGPVFTTATFIGYILRGVLGGIAATIGIFLPSFLLVLFLNPVFEKLKKSAAFTSILSGVNIASLALMARVILPISIDISSSWLLIIMFFISFISIFRFKINPIFLILSAIIIGLIAGLPS